MLVECLVIFGLILVVIVSCIRAKKKRYAFATVPLLILPLSNVLSYFISARLADIMPLDKFTVYAAINVISAIISSCLVGIMSQKLVKKASAAAYMIMSLGFNIALAAILIYNMYMTIYGQ